ncbi:hypothetical protein GYMLUDRAFT_46155 [Collybiopsis luxurians FD-317 M1]|uniref:Methyltransferase domain-containing protein n=1 Tax=Collybiopsis luxurians FD-317 M1 TaxID=944289 RepID=A0A0D0CH91_9AGAR|nr:hypothetical protein GYMLUDRAFT_46155 [Collybiopsis luxurians FD-317 M1]
MNKVEVDQQRYYASKQYLLPADESETTRLNTQHRVLTRAFENKLSLAPLKLQSSDRVLESGAGTGVWALEFSEQSKRNGVLLSIECIDISDKQFPVTHPSNIDFSVQSVTDLPDKWSGTFSYAHQRCLLLAMDDLRWHKAVSELFRVLSPGGWIELVEPEAEHLYFGVGPESKKLESLMLTALPGKGVMGDLGVYLPRILEEIGFVNVHYETRQVPIGHSGENVYRSEDWRDLLEGMKQPLLNEGGYGFVKTEEEYEELLQQSVAEWNNSSEAGCTFYTIIARKP